MFKLLRFVYSIDFLILMFSSVENALIYLFFVIIVIPGLFGLLLAYEPKGLGYFSAFLLLCACILSSILSPVSLVLFWLYGRLYGLWKKRRESRTPSQTKEVPAPPASSSVKPSSSNPSSTSTALMRDFSQHSSKFLGEDELGRKLTERIVRRTFEGVDCSQTAPSATPLQTTEYDLCVYMWTNSIMFCNQFIPKATLKQNTYLWTAFFYTVTKTIQDQVIVYKIYAQFKTATLPFITEKDKTNKYLSVVQTTYWDFRKLLNASEIDPRTDSGSHALWIFLCSQLCPELTLSSDAENKFIKCTNLILDRAVSAYQPKPTPEPTPKPTSEPVYLMEAANGMLVNVPESRLEAWEAEQDKLRKGENLELTKAERESINRILDAIYGPKDSGTE